MHMFIILLYYIYTSCMRCRHDEIKFWGKGSMVITRAGTSILSTTRDMQHVWLYCNRYRISLPSHSLSLSLYATIRLYMYVYERAEPATSQQSCLQLLLPNLFFNHRIASSQHLCSKYSTKLSILFITW